MRRPILRALSRVQLLQSPTKTIAKTIPLQCRHNSTTVPAPASSKPPPLSEISEQLRTSMRSLPHPVIILTTPPLPSSSDTTGPAHDPTGHGITLSTLTCLSLAPYPLVSFNIKTPSRTSLSLHNSGRFCIHVMSSSPHSAHVANIFAQLAASHTTKQSPWEKLRGKTEVVDGVPTMGREDGVLSRWSVVTEKYVDVQDHEVWVGRVVGVEELAGEEGKGLMYQNRRFRNVGEEVVPEFGGMGEGVAKIDVEAEAREAAGGRYKGVVSDYVNGSEF